MNKVVPYFKTIGTKKFKEFLNHEFDLDFLLKYFNGWNGKIMGDWWKFTYNNIILEFYPVYYYIRKPKGFIVQLPLPKTLNDFINDMNRLDIDLYWSDWIEENLEPKHFLPQNEIKNYYKKLLHDINKGHELLNDE